MPTKNQIIRKIRKKKLRKSRTTALNGRPQLSGVCVNVFITSPKKPNSALRKIARVKLSTGKVVNVSIPGEGHDLTAHSGVLIRGGRCRDVPGISYKIIRGVRDATPVVRSTSRSKYGCKLKLLASEGFSV